MATHQNTEGQTRLRRLIKRSYRDAADFAEKNGWNKATVTRWLNGERTPEDESKMKLREVSGGYIQPNHWFASGGHHGTKVGTAARADVRKPRSRNAQRGKSDPVRKTARSP